MVMLILKLVLFVVLTSIPFLYHYLVKPRRESIKKDRNIFTVFQSQITWGKRFLWSLGTRVICFYDKMKHRQRPRKFFTLLLVISLVGIQLVDNFASSEVATTYKQMAKEKRLDRLSVSNKKTAAPFMQRRLNNYLYPYLTHPVIYWLTLGMTLLLFLYKIADRVLTKIHNSKNTLIGLSWGILFFSYFDEGRYILLSEVLFVVGMAALFYPNFHGSTTPKGRKGIPHEMGAMRKAA